MAHLQLIHPQKNEEFPSVFGWFTSCRDTTLERGALGEEEVLAIMLEHAIYVQVWMVFCCEPNVTTWEMPS